MVGAEGLEPSRFAPLDFEPSAYTDSATPPQTQREPNAGVCVTQATSARQFSSVPQRGG